MQLKQNEYLLNRNIITPVQSYQTSRIYRSGLNYGTQGIFPHSGLNQSVNLYNNIGVPQQKTSINFNTIPNYRSVNLGMNQMNHGIQYYSTSLSPHQNKTIIAPKKQIYRENIIKNTYETPHFMQMKVLPTKYLPTKIITKDQHYNINQFAKVIPLKNYYNTESKISNSQIIQHPPEKFYTTPISNISTFTPISNISYTTEEYKTTSYQPEESSLSINYGLENLNTNTTNSQTITDNYSAKEFVNYPQEVVNNTNNTQVLYENETGNINKEYYINSPGKDKPIENVSHSYLHKSPIIEKRTEMFSPIQSPMSNYETQSYNPDSIIYKLENELFNLRAENESYKKQLLELDKYKSEAAQAKVLKQQVEQLSPLKEQVAEMATLKAQLAELSDLKVKIQELEKLRIKVDQMTSDNKRKFKSLGGRGIKKNKIIKKSIQLKANLESPNDMEEQNIDLTNDKNIILGEKVEQTFVNGDIIHKIEELEMLIRKINKSSKKMTLNLIYKASADSDRASDFHKKCDNAQNTLVLIETEKGKRFGGYTSVSWKGKCIEKMDKEAFVFSLDKMKIYENIPGEKAIGCYPKFGPVFLGCQIRIYDRAFQKGGTTYEKGLNYKTTEDFELTGGDRIFKVKDIEVYEVIPQ